MAVHIRLRRMGTKKRPFYRIVAADSRRARDGRFLEMVGLYNPITQPAEGKVHEDKITKWLDEGAVPSHTVASLLTQVGFSEKYQKAKKGEDVSEIELKPSIKERVKKTRKMKKAAVAAAEAAAAPAPKPAPEVAAEAPKEEAPKPGPEVAAEAPKEEAPKPAPEVAAEAPKEEAAEAPEPEAEKEPDKE